MKLFKRSTPQQTIQPTASGETKKGLWGKDKGEKLPVKQSAEELLKKVGLLTE